ncbi:DUF6940 family protein [Paludisphaera rhizosphaerae]|uniref:DUF6940 family protein n=1 Tax=Paludisphaera rhizosphaerae TaxID=2711216 RepID=UPI0013EBC96E|nr:hypothetical protein [Paludisphaera rhizosphaerae]
MWRLESESPRADLVRWRITGQDGVDLSFGDMLTRLSNEKAFREAWIGALRSVPMDAYCWECPPVTATTSSRPFECVLVESPLLRRLTPDPSPFAEHLTSDCSVVAFSNLGGDSLLIVPCPRSGRDFAHLARFMKAADDSQVDELWRQVGASVLERLGEVPLWLSTAGLGVSWLHVRLDSRPKYYRHTPYKTPPANHW